VSETPEHRANPTGKAKRDEASDTSTTADHPIGRNAMLTEQLTSNGFTLEMDSRRFGDLSPVDPYSPPEALRSQLSQEGYLWLRGLLDRDAVLDFRERYFRAHSQAGLLAPDSDPRDGIYAGGGEDKARVHSLVFETVRWASYESLCSSPRLVELFEGLVEGEPYLHGRKLIRHVPPGRPGATGAHYDLTYFRAGTDRILTAWIPLGDIPRAMGGVIYLEKSHSWGKQKEAEFTQLNAELSPEERISAFNKNMAETGWLTKDLPSLANRLDSRWLGADYRAGDVVVHTAYTIHASTDNVDPLGRIRLSTDIRYQRISDAIDERWSNHLTAGDNL
jgi:ectoine hydroxylase-related dioxygenase (phytanoyl-CoA dioxygenase family)